MGKLTHNQVQNQLSEDHICQGCDHDQMDCDCTESYEDLYEAHNYLNDREYLEPIDESLNIMDNYDGYSQAAWGFESDRFLLDDI